jgi:hypothetical protein
LSTSSSTGYAFDPIDPAPKQSRENRSDDTGSRWMTAGKVQGLASFRFPKKLQLISMDVCGKNLQISAIAMTCV